MAQEYILKLTGAEIDDKLSAPSLPLVGPGDEGKVLQVQNGEWVATTAPASQTTGKNIFIRYSAYPDGQNFSEQWAMGMNYLGIAIGEQAPANAGGYTWSLFASNIISTYSITLLAENWNDNQQTVEVITMDETSAVFCTPAPSAQEEYFSSKILLESATTNSLTFSCVEAPSNNLVVNIQVVANAATVDRPDSGVPPIEEQDYGKYLCAKSINGEKKAVWATLPSGGGGGSLDILDEDISTKEKINAKFIMRDINGSYYATKLQHSDYPNKVYSYIHDRNKAVYVEEVNLATGVFTSTNHELAPNQKVFVAVHAPYHLGKPYDCLPGGLILGNPTSNNAKQYYVNVVDENNFTISETSGGAVVTFTSVSGMDPSKFHFECQEAQKIEFSNLPDFDACKVVINGRIGTVYRYVTPSPSVKYSGKMGGAGYDSFSTSYQAEIYGGVHLGANGGHGSELAEIEIRIIRPGHILIETNEDVLAYDQTNAAKAQHNRKYTHWNTNATAINKITFDDGQFFNGTTVEVYVK